MDRLRPTGRSHRRAPDRRKAFAGWEPEVVVAAAVLVIVVVIVQFTGLTGRPAGFDLDEAAIAYNAWTIAQTGADEHGHAWPVFFESFGDYKSGPYIYLLAAVFKVTGPSIEAARALSASFGVVIVLALGGLAYLSTRRLEIALLTGATALLTPWTFEPTRLVFDVTLLPVAVAVYLLALYARPPTDGSRASVVLVAGLLALITYSYALGRLLGPLLALGLVVFIQRDRWKPVIWTWVVYGIMLIPFALVYLNTPGALEQRLAATGYLGRPLPDTIVTFAQQFVGNLDPIRLLFVGDTNERHHAPGIMGSLLLPTALLAIIGLGLAVRRWRTDHWGRYLLYGAVVSLIPASLTLDPFHAHRLLGLPIFLIALTIPAQQWLLEAAQRQPWRGAAFAVVVAATLVQGAYFQVRYDDVSRDRGRWFDADYPRLLEKALATGASPIYLADVVVPGYVQAYWYGTLWGVPLDRFTRIERGTRAPVAAIVLSSETDCSPCDVIDKGGWYTLYRAR